MKTAFTLVLSLVLASCNSHSQLVKKSNVKLKTECPSDGVCSLKVEQNKSLSLVNDNTINLYPEILAGDNIVLTFNYQRNEIPDTADGHYIEQILLELNPKNVEIALSNKNLENVKLVFARFCYCKGQTGYYKITRGNLKVEKVNENKYALTLTFSQDKVPQIITSITEIFELKKSL